MISALEKRPRPQYSSFDTVKLRQLPTGNGRDQSYRLELPASLKAVQKPEGLTVSLQATQSASSLSNNGTLKSLSSPLTTNGMQRTSKSRRSMHAKSQSRLLTPPGRRTNALKFLGTRSKPATFAAGFRCRPSTASEMLCATAERQMREDGCRSMTNHIAQLKKVEYRMEKNVIPAPPTSL